MVTIIYADKFYALDTRGYATTCRYDALNRLIEQQTLVEVPVDGTVAYAVQKW